MTSAPIAQQRLLIDLQDLDSHLARLRHERKHLPVLTRIEAVIERLKANKRAAIQAEAALDEAKKQATRSEDEVGQVVRGQRPAHAATFTLACSAWRTVAIIQASSVLCKA